MTAYALYNEIDPFAAAWLEQLIARGHIAPGVVDRRSIEDIHPDDLRGFRQVHFFAGIGVWSYALRRAGVADDANVWTGSCPCQPFSAAGKGGGVDDERHLWPHFHHLIRECRPALVFGEQVASKDGLAWLDLVHADMETSVYAFGALDTCAAGFGAPHIRQRLYWFGERLADAEGVDSGTRLCGDDPTRGRWLVPSDGCAVLDLGNPLGSGLEGHRSGFGAEAGYRQRSLRPVAASGELGGLAHRDDDQQRQGRDTGSSLLEGLWTEPSGRGLGGRMADSEGCRREGESIRQVSGRPERGAARHGEPGKLADADIIDDDRTGFDASTQRGELGRSAGLRRQSDPFRLADDTRGRRREECSNHGWSSVGDFEEGFTSGSIDGRRNCGSGPTNGFWADADWLHCRDERWRPVEPFTFPLAHGAAARVGRLRGYGNAINAEQAIGFLEAFFEAKAIDLAPVHETTRNLDARSLTAEL